LRLLLLEVLRFFFARVLGGQMVTDDAAAHSPQYGVMAGIMAGDAADDRTLDAALGMRARGCRARRETTGNNGRQQPVPHLEILHETALP
jgi:hypothetical protein